MSEQAELLARMLVQAEICVKELHPRIWTVVSDENRNLVELERMIFVAVLRLGAIACEGTPYHWRAALGGVRAHIGRSSICTTGGLSRYSYYLLAVRGLCAARNCARPG